MNILIIRFSSFGDVVLATAFVEAVRVKYPNAKIFFLTKAGYADVLKNNPNIEKIFVYKNNLSEIISELRIEKFDFVFDLSCNLRSFFVDLAFQFLKSKIEKIPKNIFKRRILVFLKKNPLEYVSIKQKYSRILGLENVCDTKIFLDEAEISAAKNLLRCKNDESCIAVNTGARWDTKRWIDTKYAEVINQLLLTGKNVVLLGDKNDILFNQKIVEKIIPIEEKKGQFFDLTGKLSKRQLFSVISLMDCLVTTDSASLHVSQALQVPVIALFGPTIKGFGFWHKGEKDCLIEVNLDCRPCSLHGSGKCPKGHFRCMNEISVDMVMDAVLLKSRERKKDYETI